MFFRQHIAISILFITVLSTTVAFGDQSSPLKNLLIDISGWISETPEGMDMNMGGVKMINATRQYVNNDKRFDAVIVVGTNAMMQGQSQVMNLETSEVKVSSSKIDGFHVTQSYDKSGKEGNVIVNLIKSESEGALFMLNYANLSPEEALTTAKKFSWKSIKKVAATKLN